MPKPLKIKDPNSPKLYPVKCSLCNKILGKDPIIKSIQECSDCIKGRTGKKRGSPATEDDAFSRIKKGPAKDLPKEHQIYTFRSGWERNFARYLVKTNEVWEYESEKCYFKFEGYKNKPWGYLCDFYLPGKDEYYEVKGFFKGTDRNKLRRLLKQHPEIPPKLTLVISHSNKNAIKFYTEMNIKILFIEDIKMKWGDGNWE